MLINDHLNFVCVKSCIALIPCIKVILAKISFCFSDVFPILIFFRYLLNYSYLCCASFIDVSRFLILSGKAGGYFN